MCNCGKKKPATAQTFVYTAPDGTSKTYSSELRAQMEVRSNGGKYTKQ